MENLFKRFCDREFNDVEDGIAMSCEDKRALSVMKESIKLKDGHYELALPWKNPLPSLPWNRPLVERRLNLLKKHLENDDQLLKKYSAFMNDLFEKGYARKVPNEQCDKRSNATWYLPHHPVFHPQKPDKVRVVFDCAAEYGGTSLNKELLQGPDLTNNLVGVLTRFREGPVAMMADVEAMFHQVRVRLPDCDSLRFLWWPDNDLSKEPIEYQMLVHLFGSVSSPTCVNFALRQTADDNSEQFDPETVNTVKRNFYVDDCLKSSENEKAAITTAEQLRLLLSKGGFRLTKWLSNSRKVIETIPQSERSKLVKEIRFGELPAERALGVLWNIELDTFGFAIMVKDKPFTRRGILSVVSSVYDPLGFAAPFILLAKEILQSLCRTSMGWDSPIPEEYSKRWEAWLKELPKLENLKIKRCFKPPDFGEVVSAELHHFSDASQRGYGVVSYLLLTNAKEIKHCSFVMGKSRLAPLKTITIPRLELSAAVLATKLDKSIKREIDIPINDSVFWTDSTCVPSYIASQDKRFHTFVANRVSSIHEASSPLQWNYVDTKSNPADDASRGLQVEELLKNKRWLQGPEFLWQSRENWPEQPSVGSKSIKENDPEVKKAKAFTVNATRIGELDKIFTRFSSWYRLKRFVAWMLRYRRALHKACKKDSSKEREAKRRPIQHLTVEELHEAELEIVKIVQERSFREEIAAISQNLKSSCNANVAPNPIKRSSHLYKLDPVYDKRVLRVGGRLRNSSVPEVAKHPLILPRNHHVVTLIIEFYHDLSGHCGLEHVLAMLRERFWIIRARVLIKSVLNRCFSCKKRQAPVGAQKMADLPADRVTAGKPPFTSVGVDCFGPFFVKNGRSNAKRYGVLFTCLTIRAVHIEVVSSLDTDSFLNALRRFVARRGQPEEIRSDNGTNFVGANHELRKAIKAWNQDKINEFLVQRNVRWTFNPPKASHHGGAWERCIRTVRKVLNALTNEQVLDDERLTTLMCEVEAIVNNRPITKVSDDPKDLEALTPNHLLLLRKGLECPPAVFSSNDLYLRRKWRQVQYLADLFWKRWTKEYLPCLQQRQKWSKIQRNFSVGDIVLVADENAPRNTWPLGRVVEVRRNGKDGLVRSVVVKTKLTTLDRPVTKIVLLETVENVEGGRP